MIKEDATAGPAARKINNDKGRCIQRHKEGETEKREGKKRRGKKLEEEQKGQIIYSHAKLPGWHHASYLGPKDGGAS